MRDIENNLPDAREIIKQLFPHTGNAHVIGITGFPGTGKSTLIDRLVESFRKQDRTVGVIALDPASPVSGGAVLGDRIRMQRHASDRGVFIRSLSVRDNSGGLSRAVWDFLTVMDALGMYAIFIETAGMGQVAPDIRNIVHTNIVVMIPGFGDGIQAMKAGLFETAHILVINKTDQNFSEPIFLEPAASSDSNSDGAWNPPVIKTSAIHNDGIDQLICEIEKHKQFVKNTSFEHHFRKQSENKFFELFKDCLFDSVRERLTDHHRLKEILSRLNQGAADPYSASEELTDFVMQNVSLP